MGVEVTVIVGVTLGVLVGVFVGDGVGVNGPYCPPYTTNSQLALLFGGNCPDAILTNAMYKILSYTTKSPWLYVVPIFQLPEKLTFIFF